MLSAHSFNALLKTLEEPPPHVKFLLATTDPQKLPVTVLSRCLQFNLKQMPATHIVGHLENILTAEQIGYDAQALRLLAKAADGSMRDALSLTDQAIAYSAGVVGEEAVGVGAHGAPVDAGRAVAFAVHLLERSRRKEPVVQGEAAHAERILLRLLRSGAKAVQREAEAGNAELAHGVGLIRCCRP